MNSFFLVFFILTLASNMTLCWLAFLLFRQTKEVMLGWRFMAFYGFALAGMSFAGVLRVVTEQTSFNEVFIVLIALCSLAAAVLITLGAIALRDDIGAPPKFWTKKVSLAAYAILFVLLVVIAAPRLSTLLPQRGYAIALYVFSFAHFIASAHFLQLARITKQLPWRLIMTSAFLAAAGMLLLVYSGTCCAIDGPLAGAAICADLAPPFATIFSQWCHPAFGALSKVSYGVILVATITLATGFFLVCRTFFGLLGGKKA